MESPRRVEATDSRVTLAVFGANDGDRNRSITIKEQGPHPKLQKINWVIT